MFIHVYYMYTYILQVHDMYTYTTPKDVYVTHAYTPVCVYRYICLNVYIFFNIKHIYIFTYV